MPALLQSLAVRVGNLINDADIARDTGLTSVTNRTYRRLLEGTFITASLQPWYRNTGKRLVKAGKLYFYDTLLLSYLLHSSPKELSKAQPQRFGYILENFVFSELMKLRNNANKDIQVMFYRTRDGREVDFVLKIEPPRSLVLK